MSCNITNVVLDAMDKARFASAQHRQAEHIQARRIDDTAIMAQATLAIGHRHVEPAVVRAETGCPDDRADTALVEIEHQRRIIVDTSRSEALGRIAEHRVVIDPVIDRVQKTVHLEVRQRTDIAQRTRELRNPFIHSHQSTRDPDTFRRQVCQIQDR